MIEFLKKHCRPETIALAKQIAEANAKEHRRRLEDEALTAKREGEEKVDVSKFTDKLPNLDFEVKDF